MFWLVLRDFGCFWQKCKSDLRIKQGMLVIRCLVFVTQSSYNSYLALTFQRYSNTYERSCCYTVTYMVPKVLIVEDDRDLQESLKDLLSQEGFFVKTASDGVEAINAINK